MKFRATTFTSALAVLVGTVVLVSGCGYPGSAGSRLRFPPNNSNFNSGGNFQQVDPSVFQSQAPGSDGYTNELKRCDQLRGLADSITGPCGPAINEFANEISQNCYRWFQQMYNYDCNGLESRLRNALNACAQDLSSSFSFLPGSCQNSLRRFFK